MQLVIIAGGKGTRLRDQLGDLPKPMVEIGGKPLLEHQVELAARFRLSRILILTGYGAEFIERHFGSGGLWGVQIEYRRETKPLGTAGALLDAFDKLDDVFVVMYGDTMLNVNLSRMAAAHPREAAATLFVHPNDHPQDSDVVEVDSSGLVQAIHPYPHPSGEFYPNLVNAALYVVSKDALEPWRHSSDSSPFDFTKHLFPSMISRGARIYAYRSREYIKDAGTPKRLDRVRRDYAIRRIQTGSLDTPVPAVFLDRDGTLNQEQGFLNSPDGLELLPGAAEAVRTINESGRLAVVITNQPVVARGGCTEGELGRIHAKLEWLLGESHAYLDGLYFCPHHPDAGFPGERAELKFVCSCRKPATGLFEIAARELNIDLQESWMIGDRAADIQAAQRLGMHSSLVHTGFGTTARDSCKPDFEFENVLEATKFILNGQAVRP